METLRPAVISIVLALTFGAGLCLAQSSKVNGLWNVEVTFGNGEARTLRFEAGESGKGSFRLMDPRSHSWGQSGPSEAKWTQSADGAVTFSGRVEFLIGNIGRDAGTLVLKGKLGTGAAITGEAKFFPLPQEPNDAAAQPSKSGTFNATRLTDEKSPKSSAP